MTAPPTVERGSGALIARARQEAGLTQRELAARAGTSLWRVEQVETGELDPEPLLPALAQALGVPPERLSDPGGGEAADGDGRAHDPGRHPSGRPRRFVRRRPAEDGTAQQPAGASNGHLAALVARERTTAGLTRRELAERLGVSLWDVERVEAGAPAPERPIRALTEWMEARGVAPAPPAAEPDSAAPEAADRRSRRAIRALRRRRTAAAAAPGRGHLLVLGAITLLVVIRFFTEVFPVFPRAVNFIDVPLFAALVFAGMLRGGLKRAYRREAALFVTPMLLLLTLCVLAALANPSRVEPGPALVFMYGLLSPLGIYWACYRLWPEGRGPSMSRLIIWLGIIQLAVVALIDLPMFLMTENPDVISGTFGTNAYQLVFFLMVVMAVLAGVFTFEARRGIARLAPIMFGAIFATILLAQYRALLLTMVLAVVVLALLLGSARFRGAVAAGLVAVALLVVLSYTAQAFPFLRYAPTIEAFRDDPSTYVRARAEVVGNIADMFADHPRYALTGTGPGTFSSRGWQTFALSGSRSQSNVQGEYTTLITGGRTYRTDVSEEYVLPQYHGGDVIEGSKALSSPLLSYASILAEIGLLGLAVVVLIYARALARVVRMTLVARRRARRDDPLPALLLGATVAMFVLVQMAFLENWLEVTRVTFPAWALLAVATKEFHARYGLDR